jgi:glycolate oxidase FAD binding subunit
MATAPGARGSASKRPVRGAELAEQIADAHLAGRPLRLIGGGTWLHAGRPVTADNTISARETAGVVEYTPGDLVITVGAGTTLEEIAAVTGEHNQWLALDPFGSDKGTIGATVATASSGPLASGVGRVRDLTLGVTVLASDGSAVRAGGHVVKNVAGFDLVRLQVGAWGTLGVITEVSLRLHARPEIDETVGVVLDSDMDLATLKLGMPALSLLALELVSANTIGSARSVAWTGEPWILLARVSGNRDRVRAQRALLEPLGDVMEFSNDVWRSVRDMDGKQSATVRVSDAPSRLAGTVETVRGALLAAGIGDASLCATPSSGRVRVAVPYADDDDAPIRALVKSLRTSGTSVLWEQLPHDCWAWVPPAATDPISLRIRDAFDRHHILNPGIFGAMGGHA